MAEDLYANMEIAPREVKEMVDQGAEFLFVDVRERWEYETSRIEGSTLIPLGEIPGEFGTVRTSGGSGSLLPPRNAQPGRGRVASVAGSGRRAFDDGWNRPVDHRN